NSPRPRARRDPFWDWIAITLWFVLGAIVGGAIGVRQALRYGRSDSDHLWGLAIGAGAGGLLAVLFGWRESRRHWPG
ncbi:hypothetical protein, partial [Lactococcus petauri]|uniref:hypothetical protein n=1 Tax=Lactococcus petauri TaxID=1940789 RepID=UPI0021F106BC